MANPLRGSAGTAALAEMIGTCSLRWGGGACSACGYHHGKLEAAACDGCGESRTVMFVSQDGDRLCRRCLRRARRC